MCYWSVGAVSQSHPSMGESSLSDRFGAKCCQLLDPGSLTRHVRGTLCHLVVRQLYRYTESTNDLLMTSTAMSAFCNEVYAGSVAPTPAALYPETGDKDVPTR